jgi:hypothetical protein
VKASLLPYDNNSANVPSTGPEKAIPQKFFSSLSALPDAGQEKHKESHVKH